MRNIGSIKMVNYQRAEFDSEVTEAELRDLAKLPDVEVLQCSKPVTDSTWLLLNSVYFSIRPDVQLRVYGHYGIGCDLKRARRMTNVKRFGADCLRNAENVAYIAEIPELDFLSLGIFNLTNFDVLEQLANTLKELTLGATRSKALSLAPLMRFQILKKLYIEGHSKGIEVLSELPLLEDVRLRSVTTPNLRYLRPLQNLRSLDIKLGGIRSFEGIEEKASIKYLQLWQIRELENIDVVSMLSGLQNLFLQSLPRVKRFPDVADASSLGV